MRARSPPPGSTAGRGGASGSATAASDRLAQDRADDGDHVGSFRDQGRALLEQVVGAFGARIERGAGHGEHFAALFEREARRDQRARSPGGSTTTMPTASPEMSRLRRGEIAGARLPTEPGSRSELTDGSRPWTLSIVG